MIRTEDFEQVEVRSAAELRSWLETHHASPKSVWLVTHKKAPGAPYISTDEVLDALIAFGWIDGLKRKLDAARTLQLIAPRKQQAWAKTYQDRAARLIAEGRMHPAGLQAVAAAKDSGRWNETADVDALLVPEDLAKALAAKPEAEAFFLSAAPSYRRNVLRWLKTAKQAPTRAKRIAQIVHLSGQGEKVPQL